MDQQNDITEGVSFYLEAKKRYQQNLFDIRNRDRLLNGERIQISVDDSDIEILKHLVNGKTAKETGELIFMSYRTIEARLQSMRYVLKCRNNAHLAATVVRKKIVE